MSLLYRDNQGNETHIAGLNGVSGELVPSVTLQQSGSETISSISPGAYADREITFVTPMPDTDYVLNFSTISTGGILFTVLAKTLNSFVVNIWNLNSATVDVPFNWSAFKLMTDETAQLDEAQIALNKQDITAINGKIPANASSSNQLVAKSDTVIKYDYRATGTDNVYNDIKALCNQLIGLGVNTYVGSFLRLGKTHGHYSITVSQATSPITLNGTVVIDNEQGRANSYAVSRVNNDWFIMPTILNNNIIAADCNIVVNPGIYTISSNTINTPHAGFYGILEVKGSNTDVASSSTQWIFQKILDTGGRVYTRRCINPNTVSPSSAQWTDWKMSAGEVIDISNTTVTLDANSCFYMGNIGVPDGRSEVIAVHAWTTDGQGQINGDYMCIPQQNVYNQWYCRVEGWGGGLIPSSTVWVWARYRLV